MTDATADTHGELELRPIGIGSFRTASTGWWGVMTLILTEAFLFAYLLFSYYYFALQTGRTWLPAELPAFRLSGPNTAILLLSSVAVWGAEVALKKGSRLWLALGLLVGVALGCAFVYIQYLEWMDKPFRPSSHSYGSLFYIVTGFHMAHVVGGLLVLLALLLWSILGYFDRIRSTAVSVGAAYWHFVDAVWLTVFFTFYVTPYLMVG